MIGYIYETTNLVNNKKYIGKHKCKHFDTNYYGSGIALKRALNKYGKENFSIRVIEEVAEVSLLSEREKYHICHDDFDAVKSKEYYNNSYGGEDEGWDGVNRMFRENPEKWKASREKASISQTGVTRTKETRDKISSALSGKPKSEEHRKALSKHRLSLPDEQRHKFGLNFNTLGKPSPIKGLTAETSEIVRKSRDNMIKTKNSEEWKSTRGVEMRNKLKATIEERGLNKGAKNSMYGVHTKYVSNIELDIAKRVPEDEIDDYLSKGWIKGNIHKMVKRVF